MDVHDCEVCPCSTPGATHCPCLHKSAEQRAEKGAQFCPLCGVSLDLHDGPNTCHIAAEQIGQQP